MIFYGQYHISHNLSRNPFANKSSLKFELRHVKSPTSKTNRFKWSFHFSEVVPPGHFFVRQQIDPKSRNRPKCTWQCLSKLGLAYAHTCVFQVGGGGGGGCFRSENLKQQFWHQGIIMGACWWRCSWNWSELGRGRMFCPCHVGTHVDWHVPGSPFDTQLLVQAIFPLRERIPLSFWVRLVV